MKKQYSNKNPVLKILKGAFQDLPTPTQINYLWNIGSMLGLCMIAQLIRGIVLATQYTASIQETFESVTHISRDTNIGYSFRFVHLNLASLFFLLTYLHMARGLANNRPSAKKGVWRVGIVIVIMLMATAFLGYVLPWGQMSFWGATVITNIFSAIPYLGKPLVSWLWGGFSVGQPTLTRFFALHFLLPMLLTALVIVHLIILHDTGSSNPTGQQGNLEKTNFHPYFSSKDTTPIVFTMLLMSMVTTQWPLLLGDTENSNEANPLVTPIHIQPEWYFLFAYAILRSIPSKLGGVIALLASLVAFAAPIKRKRKQCQIKNNPTVKSLALILIARFISLTWIGANPVEPPYESIGQIARVIYFTTIIAVSSI